VQTVGRGTEAKRPRGKRPARSPGRVEQPRATRALAGPIGDLAADVHKHWRWSMRRPARPAKGKGPKGKGAWGRSTPTGLLILIHNTVAYCTAGQARLHSSSAARSRTNSGDFSQVCVCVLSSGCGTAFSAHDFCQFCPCI